MKVLLLLILFYSNLNFSQEPSLRLKDIKRGFKESSNKNSLYSSWIVCNKDSAYYFKDTLKLYNHINFYYDPSYCCNFVVWEFEKNYSFRLRENNMCTEPPVSKVELYNLYKISWRIKGDELYIYIENKDKNIKEKYLVLDYYEELLWNKIHTSKVLKILRI